MSQPPFLQSRPFYAFIAILILLLFYLAGPFSASTSLQSQTVSPDARLARWLDVVAPTEDYQRGEHALNPPAQQPLSEGRPKIKLYPLGKGEQKGEPGKRPVH